MKKEGNALFFALRGLWYYLILCGREHILYEYSVSLGWVGNENVSNCADKLAVLDNGRARHECGG